MADHVIECSSGRWHLNIVGEGPPLLLLHGFTGSAVSWQQVLGRLTAERTCVALDLVGHGQTESPRDVGHYRMESVVENVFHVMSALGFDTFDCAGYSMGGRLALAMACTHPRRLRRLVLESTSPGLPTASERAARVESDEALAEFIDTHGIEAFVDKWERVPLFQSQARVPEEAAVRQRSIRLAQSTHGLANSLRGMGTGAQPSYWPHLSDVFLPVLLVTGNEDIKFCEIAKQMLAVLPNAEHTTVEPSGHTVHLEQPEKYLVAVRTFLQDSSSRGDA